jgi:nickel/cobalt transporter (NicO) family protein
MFDPVYVGVSTLGLLHGLEPGHGWPVAVLYSARQKKPLVSAVLSASVIGTGHLISSVAVVGAYVLFRTLFDFNAPWLKYVAAGILLILAYRLYMEKADEMEKQHGHVHPDLPDIEHEHEHEHPGQGKHTHIHKHSTGVALSLWGLATFAFILGFAHEEEFALLALVTSGVNAWILMLSYALAVLVGLIIVTAVSVKLYKAIQPKLIRYERYVPKISAAILAIMAIVIVIW